MIQLLISWHYGLMRKELGTMRYCGCSQTMRKQYHRGILPVFLHVALEPKMAVNRGIWAAERRILVAFRRKLCQLKLWGLWPHGTKFRTLLWRARVIMKPWDIMVEWSRSRLLSPLGHGKTGFRAEDWDVRKIRIFSGAESQFCHRTRMLATWQRTAFGLTCASERFRKKMN